MNRKQNCGADDRRKLLMFSSCNGKQLPQRTLQVQNVHNVGHQLIDFLAKVENFQKRLFEKKKFVIRTDYCITIDRVPEELWNEVLQNKDQLDEWRQLYGVDSQPTRDFLREHPYLVVDTCHFSEDFKWRLLAHFDDLDEALDGLLIKSENFQALNLLMERYRGQVKCIYIDPPYNTGSDEFIYKDLYQHSSWLSMMMDRMLLAKEAMAQDAFIYVSIDDRELEKLRLLLLSIFSEPNKVAQVVVKVKDPAGVGQQSIIFDITEYGLVFAKNIKNARLYVERHPVYEIKEITEPLRGYRHWIVSYGEKRLVKQIERPGVGVIKVYDWTNYQIRNAENIDLHDFISNAENIYADYNPSGGMLLAIKDDIPERGLSSIEYVPLRGRTAGQVTMIYFLNRRILARASDIIMVQDKKAYRRSVLTNLWEAPNAALHTEGRVGLASGKKPEALLLKIISAFSNEGSIVLDFFLGSGTSAAVAHKAKRRWLGIEGDDSVFQIALKRMKLVLYGENSGVSRQLKWKGGGFFKYLYLEQYEDTLNNLELTRKGEGQLALERFGDEYLLRYMLDFETQGSPSLLNLEEFQDPFNYKLKVHEGDEIREHVVDLVETFNYLLGIHVKKMRQFQDNGRLYRAVLGEKHGKRIVIVWRPLDGLNGDTKALQQDRQFIESVVLPALLGDDMKPDRLLVNRKCYVPAAEYIEPEFKRLMYI